MGITCIVIMKVISYERWYHNTQQCEPEEENNHFVIQMARNNFLFPEMLGFLSYPPTEKTPHLYIH